ncbi:MAG: PIG-L deacetylase family protein [Thermoleophilia bacterium]
MSVLTPGATLYLLAHHDDEVFCAARIWADQAAGRKPYLLWATAGGLAPAGRRQAEGRRVARLLSLPAGAAVSLGWSDQGAMDHLAQIFAAAVWLLDESQADCVCAPAYEGGHPDHDTMNVVAARLRSHQPELRAEEFALYRRGRGGLAVKAPWLAADVPAQWPARESVRDQLGDERAAPLAPAARALRRRLMCANASQMPTSLAPLAAVARAQGTWLSEPLRELPQHDYGRPPHRGTLLYELYTRRRFGGFAAAAAAFHE